MQLQMDHIVLNVKDEYAMTAFYEKVLMLSPERLEAYGRGEVPFPSVRINEGTIIDLFPRKMWASDPGSEGIGTTNLNHFCLAMEKASWERLRERLTTYDVHIEEGPVPRWGARGTGTSIYFRDPEGNLIEARYYDADSGVHGA